MNEKVYKQTLFGLLLFASISSNGQKKFHLNLEKGSATIENTKLSGYSTNFNFPYQEVKLSWWKYARKFGRINNLKAYYKVVIPGSKSEGISDINLYAQTNSISNASTRLFLGTKETRYEDQIKKIMIEFKKRVYINQLIEEIEHIEAKSYDLAQEYLKSKNKKLLNTQITYQVEVNRLKDKIIEIEKY